VSGPGPVVNKSRRKQVIDADGQRLPAEQSPLVSDPNDLVGDYTSPILKPGAAETVKKYADISLTHVIYPTPSKQCWPEPVPFIFWNLGIQILQQPDKVTILYSEDHAFRQVRMNQPHPARVTPSWYGDSVGHYEGDTLVIDTVGIKAERAFAMVDWFGTPYTQSLHVIERYRLLDEKATRGALERAGKEVLLGPFAYQSGWGPDPKYKDKAMQLNFTVEDEGVFTMPWSATITYRRASMSEWPEVACADATIGFHLDKNMGIPHSDKLDF
jgi:hypothetical protein